MQMGELLDFVQPEILTMRIAGKDYTVDPSAHQVLEFHTAKAKKQQENDDPGLSLVDIFEVTAPLMGCTYNPDLDVLEGEFVKEMQKANIGGGLITRIVQTVYIFHTYSPEAAEVFYKTGDWQAVADFLIPEENQNPK